MLVINFLGGPGVGKSGRAARLYSDLKALGVNCEIIPEFAKELTWAGRFRELNDQLYVFANQYHSLRRLEGNVDVAILDGSLLHNIFYKKSDETSWGREFDAVVMKAYRRYNCINVLVIRNLSADYQLNGRKEHYHLAQELDRQIVSFMRQELIPHIVLDDNNQDEVLTHVTRFVTQRGLGMSAHVITGFPEN